MHPSHSSQAGWSPEDDEIFKSLWGNGPNTPSCSVKGLSLLVANKHDLVSSTAPATPAASGMKTDQPDARVSSATAPSFGVDDGSGMMSSASVLPVNPVWSVAGGRDGSRTPWDHVVSSDLRLPLVAREAFQAVLLTSATTRHGIEDLDRAILELAGAPQVSQGRREHAGNRHMMIIGSLTNCHFVIQ